MKTHDSWPRLLLGLLLAGGLAACDNKNDDEGGTTPPAPTPTVTLTAAPTTLTLGASSTLTWTSSNATACTASGAWTGSRTTAGNQAVTPAAAGNAAYTLTCTGAGGTAAATATVVVNAPPAPVVPTVTLSAAPTALILGAATTLTWSSTNATACTASGAWSGDRAVAGTLANTPAAVGIANYVLTCTGPGGVANATAAVTVTAPPAPTVTLNAAPTSLILGASSTLTWASTDSTACTASGGWTGSRAVSGTEAVTPAAVGTASYTLTCTGPGGSANATATVTVNPTPTLSLRFDGRAVSAGGPSGDGALANAAIRVTAGGANFTGTADAAGNFSIPVTIQTSQQDSLVRIFAVAAEGSASPTASYVSQLASFRTLLTQAGPDFTLTENENFRVNVSNVGTAEAALLQEAAFGFTFPTVAAKATRARNVANIVATDSEYEAAVTAINQSELLDIAVSLSLIADQQFPLPESTPSLLAFAFDPAARHRFIDEVRASPAAPVVDETLTRLLANPDAVMGATTASVPRVAITATTGAGTEENLIGNGAPQSTGRYRFDTDGRGAFFDTNYQSDALEWSVNSGGVIEVRFAVPPSSPVTILTVVDGSFIQVDCTDSRPAIDIQPLSDTTARLRIRDQRACPGAPQLDFAVERTSNVLFVAPTSLPRIVPADVSNQVIGTRQATGRFLGADLQSFDFPGDLFNFNLDGTGVFRYRSETFTWTLDADGALVVNIDNGIRITYRKLRRLFTGADLYFAEFEADGVRRSLQSPAYMANFALQFSPQNLVGTLYAQGLGSVAGFESVDFGTPATATQLALLRGFAIEVFDNGLFDQRSDRLATDAEGQVVRSFSLMRDFDTGRYWRILPDGSLSFRTYLLLDSFAPGVGCGFDGTGVANCYLSVERFVFPYFLHGERQGWFELLRNFDQQGTLINEDPRTFFYTRGASGEWALPRENANLQQLHPNAVPEITPDDLRGKTRSRDPMIKAIREGRAVRN